nr:hypothetical protein [Candidatus Njordarchaeota archaeon]
MVLETKEIIGGIVLIVFGILCIVFPTFLSTVVGLALILFGLTEFLPKKK